MKKVNFTYTVLLLIGLCFIHLSCMSNNQTIVKEKFMDFNGYNIHYEIYGSSQSTKNLVFIHGWSGNTNIWTNQLNAFPDYKIIAIDLPGHGKSSKKIDAEYNIELFVNSISAVLDNEQIEQAFIFGHSMGFAVTEVFALKYPEKTIGIGSIDGAHFEVESDEKSQNEWIAYNTFMAESMNEEKGREDFINTLFLPETPEELRNDILKSSKITPLQIGKKIISSMSNDMSYWENRVTDIPCFVIHSPVYQLSCDYKVDFKKMYPKTEYHEIDGVSHFLMLEIPEILNELILRYLNKVY